MSWRKIEEVYCFSFPPLCLCIFIGVKKLVGDVLTKKNWRYILKPSVTEKTEISCEVCVF